MDAKFEDETIQSLIELGRVSAGPQMAPGANVPYVIVNGQVKLLPELIYNDHAEAPERIKANVAVYDPVSFAEYFTQFANDASLCFADEVNATILAVFDYHEAHGSPRWCQHRLTLIMRPSVEWRAWMGMNNKQMTQQVFSEFLEQNSLDIIDPTPAAIVDVARDLQGTTEVEFGSGLRMENGQVRFKYVETTKTTTGAGAVTVPDAFTLAIPAFIGGNPGRLQALLRYRCKEGKLTFWYTLVRPDYYVREAFVAARDAIAAALGRTILNGIPG